jgi:hypothetical protein
VAVENSLKALISVLALVASAGPAFAFNLIPLPRPHPAPAPDLGVGATAVLAVAAAYLLARLVIRRRAQRQALVS